MTPEEKRERKQVRCTLSKVGTNAYLPLAERGLFPTTQTSKGPPIQGPAPC